MSASPRPRAVLRAVSRTGIVHAAPGSAKPALFGRAARILALTVFAPLAFAHPVGAQDASLEAVAPDAPPPPSAAVAAGVGPVTHLPLPRYVSMRGESANARRGPSLDQRVDREFVRRGQPLEVIAEYGNWRRVRDADGAGGWVHQALLSGTRTAVVLGPDPVSLLEEPAAAARAVATAEPGVIGRVDACAGDWCEITAGGIDGWLPRAALWGVTPGETID